ncbi:MAG: diadenylate cyclase CdaA [Bacteroidetes bacterium]|nr:diadenylate cyclase CdaA [Bacteroidota bacterium]
MFPLIFIHLRWLDFIDILIVAILLYQLYHLVKGTIAINIFFGILAFYLIWLFVKALNMQLLATILGQFIGVGVIALIIVFQQELRRFLLMLGSRGLFSRENLRPFTSFRRSAYAGLNYESVVTACQRMALNHTGALIVLTRKSDLKYYVNTGERIDSEVTPSILESIFFKNNPLHDGAVIISDNRIKAVKCVLPLTENTVFPFRLGLRHRAAVGITEQSDAIALIVSEQSGEIAIARNGALKTSVTPKQLNEILAEEFGD